MITCFNVMLHIVSNGVGGGGSMRSISSGSMRGRVRGGGPPRVTPSRWHPDESRSFFRLNFTKSTGETITWKGRRGWEWWRWPKGSSVFWLKIGWHHQLSHMVTPTPVTLQSISAISSTVCRVYESWKWTLHEPLAQSMLSKQYRRSQR